MTPKAKNRTIGLISFFSGVIVTVIIFAFHNSPVLCHRIGLADGKELELLVAFYDADYTQPQAVLLRYHGRGLESQQVLP